MEQFKAPAIMRQQSLKESRSRLPCDPSADAFAHNLVSKYAALVVWRPHGGGQVEAAAVPSEAEKLALMGRLERLGDTLLPASTTTNDVARVAAAVSSMLGGGYASLQNVDRRATIAGYTEAMQDLPAWAVERGCNAVRKGKVDDLDPKWPPTHAHLHQIAERELAPVRAEQAQIAGVLALELPPQRDEAATERMNTAAKAWLDRSDPIAQQIAGAEGGAKATTEASERTRSRMIEGGQTEIEREWLAAGLEPRPYSMSLAKQLGALGNGKNSDEAAA